ncbi:MAG: hypothetical protein M1839_008196 [Geoglossum umbratile]|nr:MAG: hypothetical protein M1839_008196 [Geoglossum umbratile]
MHKRRRVAGKERPEAEPQSPERVPSRKAIASRPLIQSDVAGLRRSPSSEDAEIASSRSRPELGPHITLCSTVAAGNVHAPARREASLTTSPANQGLIRRREHLKLRTNPGTDKITLGECPTIWAKPWGCPLLPCDSDVAAAAPIDSPPSIKNRRKVERFARIFALVAFRTAAYAASTSRITTTNSSMGLSHGWMFPKEYSAPQFLVCLLSISRNFRYAAILAFTTLTFLEFAGRRTDIYVKSKATNLLVYDLRPWYFHRYAQVSSLIRGMKRWWGERAWEYMLSSGWSTNAYGLYFGGISSQLLGNPDHRAQWDVALRFWIQRFSTYVGEMGSGCRQLLRNLQAQMVLSCEPLLSPNYDDASNDSPFPEIWRLGTRDGGVFFVLGRTGEVLGWSSRSAQRRVSNLTFTDTTRTAPRQELAIRSKICMPTFQATTNWAPHMGPHGWMTYEDVTWQDLRGDWQAYTSILHSNRNISTEPTIKPLIQHVFHPSLNKTHPHGINIAVTLPHHCALAERFVLTHVHAGGVSGPQLLPPIAARKPRIALDLEHKWTVESVRCSGERYRSSMTNGLAPGVGFVQTPEAGWFVLEETGQEIAMEEYGIQGLWATILGVKEDGSALPKQDVEALRSHFVRD